MTSRLPGICLGTARVAQASGPNALGADPPATSGVRRDVQEDVPPMGRPNLQLVERVGEHRSKVWSCLVILGMFTKGAGFDPQPEN